jgi:hypothetical protein
MGMLAALIGCVVVTTHAQTQAADGAPAAEVESIDIGRYLPEGLRKPFDRDFEGVSWDDFFEAVGQVSGMPVRMDRRKLAEGGADLFGSIQFKSKGVPVYVVLNWIDADRLDSVGWTTDGKSIRITTDAIVKSESAMTTEVFDVHELLESGSDTRSLMNLLKCQTSDDIRWEDDDGEGGGMTPVGESLVVRQSVRGMLFVRGLIDGCRSKAAVCRVGTRQLDLKARQVLDRPVSCDFHDTPLADAVRSLSLKLNFEIGLDQAGLEKAGVAMAEAPVTLTATDTPLREIFDQILKDVIGVQLIYVVHDGRILVTSSDSELSELQYVYVAIYRLGPLAERATRLSILQAVKVGTGLMWADEDGEGGELSPVVRTRLAVRQTLDGQDEVGSLIERMISAAGSQPLPSTPLYARPETIEVRQYRMPSKQAADFVRLLPQLVSPDQWEKLPDGTKPILETAAISAKPPYSIASLDSLTWKHSSDPTWRGGVNDSLDVFVSSLRACLDLRMAEAAGPEAVLIIRQTHAVQNEIWGFLVKTNAAGVAEAPRFWGAGGPIGALSGSGVGGVESGK